jgi:hypothetical protein
MIEKLKQIEEEARNCSKEDLRHVVQHLAQILIENERNKRKTKKSQLPVTGTAKKRK